MEEKVEIHAKISSILELVAKLWSNLGVNHDLSICSVNHLTKWSSFDSNCICF